MILKYYELEKIDLNANKFILLYGKNEGLKNEQITNLVKKYENKIISKYYEKQVLDNQEIFYDNIFSGSLFEKEKIIILKNCTDKLVKIIEELIEKKTTDIAFLLDASVLEKKSKLRSLFEKNKQLTCVAFYPDTNQALINLAQNFLRSKKILISSSNVSFIVNRCNGDRESLKNELEKIELFSKSRKTVTLDDIIKLTNLIENHTIAELIDNCLAKNQKRTISILNENNFVSEESITIIRTFLNKSKRILKLTSEFQKNKNIEKTLTYAKPPIFWKDKEIVKQHIYKWTPNKIKDLIFNLNEIELKIKKGAYNPINIILNFILEQSSTNTNN